MCIYDPRQLLNLYEQCCHSKGSRIAAENRKNNREAVVRMGLQPFEHDLTERVSTQTGLIPFERDTVERAAGRGIKLEWMEDGVKLIMGPIPAIKVDKSRGRKIWFNHTVTIAHKGFKDVRNDLANAVTFGDGTLLPADIINDCQKIMEEESVAIPWKKGDILLIDNMAVLHSRRSFDPPRRVLASLCK